MSLTYKHHALIGVWHVGGYSVIKMWDHTPTGPQVEEAKTGAAASFDEFILMTPVGESLPGNYVATTTDESFYG